MKKFFAFLAAGLFLTACSDDVAAPQVGQEQEVTLSFQLPEAIASRAANGGTNSALGGASNCSGEVTFTAALYYNGKEVWRDDATAAIPNANASVTFKPTLVLGENYELVAYAQMDGVITDLTKQVEANAINDETVDAYYVSTTIKAEATMSATLKRATGKLRIIAEDFAATEKQLGKTIESVAITYKQAQPTEFNPTTGNWATEASEVTFSEVVTDYTSEGDAKTLLVDYIPATATGEIINIDKVVVTFSDGTTFEKSLATLDVPVKRNYLTTLTGNFFLGEMDLKIEIDDAFEGEEEINYELAAAFANGGVYTLEEDVVISKELFLAAGKSLVLNLNGHNITSDVDAIVAEGNLTINGEGVVKALTYDPVWAKGDAVVTINGGTYISEGECEAVYARDNAKVIINGGTFEAKVPYNGILYTLNLKDDSNASIVVYGGTFVNFDPANNKSENPPYNFVAEGYESVNVGNNVFEVCVAPKTVDGVVTLNADASVIKSIVLAGASLQGNNNTIAVSKNVATNYIVNGTGDVTVSDVVIEGNNVYWGEKSTRALYFTKPGNITIENVTVKNVGYALNVNAAVNAEENNLVVRNSSLVGWISYGGAIDNASFSNVAFGISNYFEAGSDFNGGIRPYCETVFENCKFEKGYVVSFTQGKAMTFKGCTVDGVALTAENFATLLKVEGDATGLLNF